jgi:hypothetical protein
MAKSEPTPIPSIPSTPIQLAIAHNPDNNPDTDTEPVEVEPVADPEAKAQRLAEIAAKIEAGEGLNGAELADYFDFGRSAVSSNSKEADHFAEWSQANDPDKKPWRFEGEGKKKRFFRLD